MNDDLELRRIALRLQPSSGVFPRVSPFARRRGSAWLWVLVVLLALGLGAMGLMAGLQIGGYFDEVPPGLEAFVQTGSVRTATGQEGDVRFSYSVCESPQRRIVGLALEQHVHCRNHGNRLQVEERG
jgi:hypothetical protein